MIGFAVQTIRRAWALIRNEHNEDRFLYECNLETGEIRFKEALDADFTKIRYSNGMLILIAEEEGIVRCLKVTS